LQMPAILHGEIHVTALQGEGSDGRAAGIELVEQAAENCGLPSSSEGPEKLQKRPRHGSF
jgi:hypothetical protein